MNIRIHIRRSLKNDQIEIQIMISSAPQSASRCWVIVSVLKYNQVVGHSYGQQFYFVSGTIYINEMISISGSKLICKCGEGWSEGGRCWFPIHGFLEMEMTLVLASYWSFRNKTCCWLVTGDICISLLVEVSKEWLRIPLFAQLSALRLFALSRVSLVLTAAARARPGVSLLNGCYRFVKFSKQPHTAPQDRHLSGRDRFVTRGLGAKQGSQKSGLNSTKLTKLWLGSWYGYRW